MGRPVVLNTKQVAAPTVAPEDDHTLLALIQQGNHRAFAALLEKHTDRFYGLAFRYMAEKSEAEDIVQEAFLKLWEQPHSWNAEKGVSFTTWFYRVVANLCLDRKKKHKPVFMAVLPEVHDTSLKPDELFAVNQQKTMLEKEMRGLPLRQQMALRLCYQDGLSHDEAAKIMGVKIKVLEALISRGKNNLKQRMKRV